MSMKQKFRAYWRLIFLVPVAAYAVCLADLQHNQPTQGTTWLASLAVVVFMVHLFRFAIGGALVLAEGWQTPLRTATADFGGSGVDKSLDELQKAITKLAEQMAAQKTTNAEAWAMLAAELNARADRWLDAPFVIGHQGGDKAPPRPPADPVSPYLYGAD